MWLRVITLINITPRNYIVRWRCEILWNRLKITRIFHRLNDTGYFPSANVTNSYRDHKIDKSREVNFNKNVTAKSLRTFPYLLSSKHWHNGLNFETSNRLYSQYLQIPNIHREIPCKTIKWLFFKKTLKNNFSIH